VSGLLHLTVLALASPSAQDTVAQRIRVELLVTGSTERSVFVDTGSSSGLAIGDRASLRPGSGPPVEGIVRAVTSHHARIELLAPGTPTPVGTRGEVWIQLELPGEVEEPQLAPPAETEQQLAPTTQPPPPDHPPWQAPPEEWLDSRPLLAPAVSSPMRDRATSIHGRVWAGARWRTTELNGRRESGYLRGGAYWSAENPFARGGALVFDAELYARYYDSDLGQSDRQSELRLSRLYYELGGRRDSSRALRLGRFYQESIPEFGPIDGVEFAERIDVQNEVGASVGHMPRISGELEVSEDYQAAVFYRHRSTSELPIDWRVGYQKTWHDGHQDRDLFLLDSNLRTRDQFFLSGTAWIDYYEKDETQKDERLELTRLYLAAGRNSLDGDGIRLSYSEFRYPLILRQEFDEGLNDEIFEEHNSRLGLDGWATMSGGVRVHGRADRWADEDDGGEDGYGAELGCDLPRFLPGDAELGVTLFGSQGEFSKNSGLRVSALGYQEGNLWSFSWELSAVDETSDNTPTPTEWQNALRGSYDTQIFEEFNLSLDLGGGWGDQGNTLSLGLYLQRSF
jgi:hypothetical protein